jgi:hypothetical protein
MRDLDPKSPAKMHLKPQSPRVIESVMGATKRDDAIRVCTTADALGHHVRRIDRPALTDNAGQTNHLLPLLGRRRH